MRDGIDVKGGSTGLRNSVKELGFRWKETRKVRVDLDQEARRTMYASILPHTPDKCGEVRPIAYEDQTYVHCSHTRSPDWTGCTGSVGGRSPWLLSSKRTIQVGTTTVK